MGICGTKQVKVHDSQPITRASIPAPVKSHDSPQVRMRQIDHKKALDVPALAINTSKIYQRRKQHSDSRLLPPAEVSAKHSFAGS